MKRGKVYCLQLPPCPHPESVTILTPSENQPKNTKNVQSKFPPVEKMVKFAAFTNIFKKNIKIVLDAALVSILRFEAKLENI